MGRIVLAISLALWCAGSLPAADWKAVSRDELAETKPTIDPAAGAEALLWEVRVDDVDERLTDVQRVTSAQSNAAPITVRIRLATVLDNYMRIKIYNNTGRDRFSTVRLNATGISNISGRTIQPDGKILELSKDAILDSSPTQKSFTLAGVVPGSVIEYKWRETRPYLSGYQVLSMQQNDLPIRLVRYFVKPSANMGAPAIQEFHGAERTPLMKEPGGFFSTTLANVPAFRNEPYMPPRDEVAAWLLVFYWKDSSQTAQQFWADRSQQIYTSLRTSRRWEVSGEIRKLAAELIAGASSPEEKLARLYDFCRLHILSRSSGLATVDQRNAAKTNETPSDTLHQKLGYDADIRNLFAALATAAGFEARPADLPSRSRILSFNPNYPNSYFAAQVAVAVRVGDGWRLYDPASRYSEAGMLPWDRQGVFAMISDPKGPVFVRTPMAAPEKSAINHTGHFRLGEDGTLEGDATIEFTGMEGAARKQAGERQADPNHEAAVKNLMRGIPAAEVSGVTVENATDPDKPFTYRFHLRVPNYAQVTGKRVLFAPAVFEQGLPAKFTAKERVQDVYFSYPWMESDSVTIDLPDGYAFDNADMPGSFQIENTGKYEIHAQVQGGKQLVYSRRFTFGTGGNIRFPANVYAGVKGVFDQVHESDGHTLALRITDGGGK